jgi:hypothetical protein
VGHHVGENPLARQTAAADALALLGHGAVTQMGEWGTVVETDGHAGGLAEARQPPDWSEG